MKEGRELTRKETKIMERQVLKILDIELKWCEWIRWDDLKEDARKGGINVPNESGVYEVKYLRDKKRLTIGRSSVLRRRVKQALVKGKMGHPSGEKIRAKENTSKIVVRWAITDRHAAAEEELHRRHKRRFGELPIHVGHT